MFETAEHDDLLQDLKEQNNRSFERLRRLIRDLQKVVEEPDWRGEKSYERDRGTR